MDTSLQQTQWNLYLYRVLGENVTGLVYFPAGLSFLSFVFFFHYCVSSSVSRQKYHPIDNIIRQPLSKGACVRYWPGRRLVYVCPLL